MPSRRTTLGPSAVNNRRTSTGASSGRTAKQRMSIAAPRVSSSADDAPHNHNGNVEALTVSNTPAISGMGRRSLATGLSNSNSENRRMSTLPPMANAMRTDPRPINDKAYMNACIKNLTQYLLSNGYDQVVSTKSLARPSATEFTNIITYLLRKIDPTFNSFGSKFEDEVAQAFKRIGYPLNVSKTALAAVGSPHTWPALLSALTWLIELLNCDEATPKEEDWKNTRAQQQLDVKEIEERGARTFYKFVSESYLAFLLGNDERVVYCEDKFIECFERDTAIVAQKVDEITDWNAHLVASMEQLRNTTNE
jgi:kinetochore protein NDC80